MADNPKKGQITRIEYQEKHRNNQEKIEEEEIEIGAPASDESEEPFQGHRNIHFQTTGCIGALVALVITAFLFFVFLPLGIVVLLGVFGYYAWKSRR